MKDSTIKNAGYSALTILILFFVWTIISLAKNNDMIYPSIDLIGKAFIRIINASNCKAFLFTILRVLLNLAICLVIATILAILTIKVPIVYQIVAPLMRLMRTIPFVCLSIMIVPLLIDALMPPVLIIAISTPYFSSIKSVA